MTKFREPHIVHEPIGEDENRGRFTVEPLERGYGYTLGNTLRRVLLSSLQGAAVTSVRIEGVQHEFMTVKGVQEDVTDIILNLKELVFRLHDDAYLDEEPPRARLRADKAGVVTASNVQLPSDLEIVNPDHKIATLSKGGVLDIELAVKTGRGYVSAERNKRPADPIGVIPVDSLFSPVSRVTYNVENTRVGQRTDYDKLILEVETNGSKTAKEAVAEAASIITNHMSLFIEQAEVEEVESIFESGEGERNPAMDIPIEDLELTVRSYNCLKRQSINTVEQLLDYSEADLLNIRNFGAKSIEEVKDKLQQLGYGLKPA
jgi:DNA-directed RNA polymerase subunit alpha